MNILTILSNLYTNKTASWINEIEDEFIQPYVIQRWLVMNDNIRVLTRWLDKYVFVLSPKMYLSLAWSILPKNDKMPFIKYIKKNEEDEEFDFILYKVRKYFDMSDNDYNSNKQLLLKEIKNDMPFWFSWFGVEKRYWIKYKQDFNKIKTFNNTNVMKISNSLNKWGI